MKDIHKIKAVTIVFMIIVIILLGVSYALKIQKMKAKERSCSATAVCSLPEGGIPKGMRWTSTSAIKYIYDVPIPALNALFEKYLIIDINTGVTRESEEKEIYSQKSKDGTVEIRLVPSYGFKYVAVGNNLQQVNTSTFTLGVRKSGTGWVEVGTYMSEPEGLILSPDGQRIAIAVNGEVVLLKLSGEKVKNLKNEDLYFKFPFFDAISDTVFVLGVNEKTHESSIFIWDVLSDKISSVIKDNNLLDYSISPDKKLIAYITKDGDEKKLIKIINIDNRKLWCQTMTGTSGQPFIFSDDGKILYFINENSLYKLQIE